MLALEVSAKAPSLPTSSTHTFVNHQFLRKMEVFPWFVSLSLLKRFVLGWQCLFAGFFKIDIPLGSMYGKRRKNISAVPWILWVCFLVTNFLPK